MGENIIIFLPCDIKGAVSVISSDPSCRNGNAWFTTVSLKALFDKVWIIYACFCLFNYFFFIFGFLEKFTGKDYRNKHFLS